MLKPARIPLRSDRNLGRNLFLVIAVLSTSVVAVVLVTAGAEELGDRPAAGLRSNISQVGVSRIAAPNLLGNEGFCGDGVIDYQQSEECDDMDDNDFNGCRNDCSAINYVPNPDFTDGISHWFTHKTTGCRTVNAELDVSFTCDSSRPQVLTVLNEHLEGGYDYRLSFRSRVIRAPFLIIGRVDLFKDTDEFEKFWEQGLEERFFPRRQYQTHEYVFKTTTHGRHLPEPRLALFFVCQKNAENVTGVDGRAQIRLDHFILEKVQARCGDGLVQLGEACDPKADPDGCTEHCQLPAPCGNGVLDPGEECDDGGLSATCDKDCTAAECGDGTLNPLAGEWCDDGNDVAVDLCDQCQRNPNVAQNGNFSEVADWWAVHPGVLQFDYEKSTGLAAKYSPPASGGILRQSGLILKGNTRYSVSFEASNDKNRNMFVQVFMNRPPNDSYGLDEFVNLTSAKRPFSFEFTTPDVGAINDARLHFRFVPRVASTTYRIQKVVVQEVN